MFNNAIYKNLEKYWQWRLAKIIAFFIVITIWIIGTFHIWLYFSFNPYKYAYYGNDYVRANIFWGYEDTRDIARFKMRHMENEFNSLQASDNLVTILRERANNYESLKYLKMLVAILIYTGAIVLALILLSRIVEYIVQGNKQSKDISCCESTNKTPSEEVVATQTQEKSFEENLDADKTDADKKEEKLSEEKQENK